MEFSIVSENLFKKLNKIDSSIRVIYLEQDQLDSDYKNLLQYLANGKIKDFFWSETKFPKYLFVKQFGQDLLITIRDDHKKDTFSESFAGNIKSHTFKELFSE